MQSLIEKVAAKSIHLKGDRQMRYFFDAIRKEIKFIWTSDYQFQELLQHTERPPVLSKHLDVDLFIYLAVSVLELALVCEESRIQRSAYYISRQFTRAETNYLKLKKLSIVC